MNTMNAPRRPARAVVAGLVAALAITSTLGAVAPKQAHAATTTRAAVTRTATHHNGDSLTMKLSGRTIYANWYKIDGQWYAVFATVNGTKMYGVPNGNSWKIYAVNGSKKTAAVCTTYESTKVGKLGPKGKSSHFKAANANVWY